MQDVTITILTPGKEPDVSTELLPNPFPFDTSIASRHLLPKGGSVEFAHPEAR